MPTRAGIVLYIHHTPFTIHHVHLTFYSLGSFKGAIPLNTKMFSETFNKLHDILDAGGVDMDTPIYTFCTGGRCLCVCINIY
ncbi:hypothetical protein EON63_16350 [archaeon]|nr:MAG: hypothetical protein EON63_16350 [archaeon]